MIVSLFDYSGVWSQPYVDAGYEVLRVDIQNGHDVYDDRLYQLRGVHGVLASPPCTDFSRAGARWMAEKDRGGRTAVSVALVDRTLNLIGHWAPKWWALENPPGRIANLVPRLGRPHFKYQPFEFGDPRRKITYLWGDFTPPDKGPFVEAGPAQSPGGWYNKVGGASLATKNYRSITCEPFAWAFFRANP